jgi:uncharacterized protein (DUF302 family)
MQAVQTASKKVEVERFSVTPSKPFEAIAAALRAAVGRPDMVEFKRTIDNAHSFSELEESIRRAVGDIGLMLFLELDLGAFIRKESGRESPKALRFLIGNPLIMKEMLKHVPDAGSYAPVTILLDERRDGVHLTYDKMSSFLAPYGDDEALAVSRDLDSKIIALLQRVAQ